MTSGRHSGILHLEYFFKKFFICVFFPYRNCKMRKKQRQFPLDCIYAFGLPSLISAAVYLLDSTEILPEYLRIGMGHNDCFIRHKKAINMFYLYIPIFFVLFINFVFFVITTYKIFQVQRETSFVLKGCNKKHSRNDLQRNKYFI